MTKRLRWSLQWFQSLLSHSLAREVPYSRDPNPGRVLIYSDAKGNGMISAVLLISTSATSFRAPVPRELRRMLRARATNIVAFERVAAIVAIITFTRMIDQSLEIHHYIDSTPALNCLVKGFSRQDDLRSLVGQLWFRSSTHMAALWAAYVPSACNVADGPSRGDVSLMKRIGARVISVDIPPTLLSVELWMSTPQADRVMC